MSKTATLRAPYPEDEPASLIAHDGFLFMPGARMHELLAEAGSLTDWHAFAASWDDLALDTFMADKGRYRKRRHAVFAATPVGVRRAPPQPHYQSRDYNALNGGIERWFEPIRPEIGAGQSFTAILNYCHGLFGPLAPAVQNWHIEVHQFRIEARAGEHGQPTPEGMHRDGVDYVLVLMINRRNIASGTTTIESHDRQPLGSFTLTEPFDAALVDDARVMHGVTPVTPLDPALPAYRDVLVVTFRTK